MCAFDVCLSVCVSVCVRSGPVNQTTLKWELNANSSKTVKATDFKFDTNVPRDMTSKIFQKGECRESRDPLNFWALNVHSSKTVKIRASYLMCMFPGTV